MIVLTRREAGAAMIALVGTSALAAGPDTSIPTTWDLTAIMRDDAAWEAARQALLAALAGAADQRRLGDIGGAELATLLDHATDIQRHALRLDTYARLKVDVDPSAANRQLQLQAQALSAAVDQGLGWLEPGIIALGRARLDQLLAAEPRLGPFRPMLADTLRGAPHVMSDEARAILGSNVLVDAPEALQRDLAATARPRAIATLSDGRSIPIDERSFSVLSRSPSATDRERVAKAYWGGYAALETAFGLTLTAAVQADVLRARAAKFRSSRDAAMFALALPEPVYTAMLDAVQQGLPALHRYYALRRRMLKLPVLHACDLSVPLSSADRTWDIRQAREHLLAAVQPLGADYAALLARATLAGWMDAYPRPGKVAGGYCNPGAYDVHPYVLLNFTPNYAGATSFAHEWGHAMHGELARTAQPFQTFNAPPFVQEMASTCHEQLLILHMIRTAQSREEKLFYLSQRLETFASVFFVQAMRADFEAELHRLVEAGTVPDGPTITDLYLATWQRYAGPELMVERDYAVAWARQVQYYEPFYVFQYVTALTGGVHFATSVLTDPGRGRDNYVSMLRAGGSVHGYDLVRAHGLDLASPDPYAGVVGEFVRTMEDFEQLSPPDHVHGQGR